MNRTEQYTNNLGKRLERTLIKQSKILRKLNKVTLRIKQIDEKMVKDKL